MINSRVSDSTWPQEPRREINRLTSQHHSAEHAVVPFQRAAVPAVVPELVLAFSDPLFGSLANGLHQVRVPLAELPLLVHQAGDVVTDHPGTQRSNVPAGATEIKAFQTKTTCKRCSWHFSHLAAHTNSNYLDFDIDPRGKKLLTVAFVWWHLDRCVKRSGGKSTDK